MYRVDVAIGGLWLVSVLIGGIDVVSIGGLPLVRPVNWLYQSSGETSEPVLYQMQEVDTF